MDSNRRDSFGSIHGMAVEPSPEPVKPPEVAPVFADGLSSFHHDKSSLENVWLMRTTPSIELSIGSSGICLPAANYQPSRLFHYRPITDNAEYFKDPLRSCQISFLILIGI